MPIFDKTVQMKGLHSYSSIPVPPVLPSLGRVLWPKSSWTRLAGSSIPSCAEQLGALRVCSAQETLPRMQTKDMSVKASFVNYISYRFLGGFKGGKRRLKCNYLTSQNNRHAFVSLYISVLVNWTWHPQSPKDLRALIVRPKASSLWLPFLVE